MRRTLLVVFLAAGLAGCSCDSCEPADLWGNVFVDNYTDESPDPDNVWFFQLAPVGQPWTGNLLDLPVQPGGTQFVGTFHEDYYDAYAETDLGDFVEWFEVFVGLGEDVFFEVY